LEHLDCECPIKPATITKVLALLEDNLIESLGAGVLISDPIGCSRNVASVAIPLTAGILITNWGLISITNDLQVVITPSCRSSYSRNDRPLLGQLYGSSVDRETGQREKSEAHQDRPGRNSTERIRYLAMQSWSKKERQRGLNQMITKGLRGKKRKNKTSLS